MQIGILGLPKVGKTTLFNTLTASRQETGKFSTSKKTNVAVAKVPDERLAKLRDVYNPKRYVPATVEYVDIPGLKKGEGKASLNLAELRGVDALVHVVRAFDDEELLHTEGSIDPARDVETMDLELILADYEVMERRVDRLRRAKKGGLEAAEEKELELLECTVLPALEAEKPLRSVELSPDDEKRLRGFQLLSAKPILVVVNVSEDRVTESPADLGIRIDAGGNYGAMLVSAPIEDEIVQLSEEEQREFLADLGLEEPSLSRVLRASYELLGLISFFTVGEDEVRAWTIRRGTVARDAAGAIHSDIARGFIRAEVVPWDDLLRLGSMAKARDEGILRLEGKEYVMQDGNVAHFRFNV
jgi:GTP-binding protein YchF